MNTIGVKFIVDSTNVSLLVLINNLGEIVLETKILAGENSIDLSVLETGVYFITLGREISYMRFKVIMMQ